MYPALFVAPGRTEGRKNVTYTEHCEEIGWIQFVQRISAISLSNTLKRQTTCDTLKCSRSPCDQESTGDPKGRRSVGFCAAAAAAVTSPRGGGGGGDINPEIKPRARSGEGEGGGAALRCLSVYRRRIRLGGRETQKVA